MLSTPEDIFKPKFDLPPGDEAPSLQKHEERAPGKSCTADFRYAFRL